MYGYNPVNQKIFEYVLSGANWQLTGKSWIISTPSLIDDIYFNGSDWFGAGWQAYDTVFRYNQNFTYQENYTILSPSPYISYNSLYSDGDYWYLGSGSNLIFKYSKNWTYLGNYTLNNEYEQYDYISNLYYNTSDKYWYAGGPYIYKYYFEDEYHPTGTYTSQVIDVGSDVGWNSLEWVSSDNGWDISILAPNNVNISSQDSSPMDLFLKPDGTKLYEIGRGQDKVYQYTCSNAWDLSSCASDNVNISTQGANPSGLFFKPDGTTLFEMSYNPDIIYQYTCSNAWDLSSCTSDNVNMSTQSSTPFDLFFKPDGTKLYEIETGGWIFQHTCSVPWDLSSCTYDSIYLQVGGNGLTDLFFKPDGTKLYKLNYDPDTIYQYNCLDAWNLSSCTPDYFIPAQDPSPMGFFFKPDGTKIYETGWGGLIYEYSLNPEVKFQVRSCNDNNCSGETFVGPSNTPTTYFTSSSTELNSTIAPVNRYFQYKSFFSTSNLSLTPYLNSVGIQWDTCSYGSVGNWNIDCSHNCIVKKNFDLLGNNLSITGTGSFTIDGGNISNYDGLLIEGTNSTDKCKVYCLDGGCFVSFFVSLLKFTGFFSLLFFGFFDYAKHLNIFKDNYNIYNIYNIYIINNIKGKLW
jgi:hypothetical protein